MNSKTHTDHKQERLFCFIQYKAVLKSSAGRNNIINFMESVSMYLYNWFVVVKKKKKTIPEEEDQLIVVVALMMLQGKTM